MDAQMKQLSTYHHKQAKKSKPFFHLLLALYFSGKGKYISKKKIMLDLEVMVLRLFSPVTKARSAFLTAVREEGKKSRYVETCFVQNSGTCTLLGAKF